MGFTNQFGFDVSYYQGVINFEQMKNYGAKFVILRCGYSKYKDVLFDEYMQSAPLYLPVRVYHYYDPVIPPLEQANSIITTLAPYRLQGQRVWLDFEFPWTGAYSVPSHWKIYRDAIRQAGYRTGIYTRATWWDSRVGTYAAEFATDPVWAAQYNTSLTMIPKGWSRAMLWQSGTPSIGLSAGVQSLEIDYDVWNDDYNFADEWGVTSPPPTGGTMYYKVIGTQGLNLRPSPSTSNTPLLLAPTGTIITAAPDVAGWLKGTAYQKPGAATVNLAFYCSSLASLVEPYTPTTPPTNRHVVEVYIDGVLDYKKELD